MNGWVCRCVDVLYSRSSHFSYWYDHRTWKTESPSSPVLPLQEIALFIHSWASPLLLFSVFYQTAAVEKMSCASATFGKQNSTFLHFVLLGTVKTICSHSFLWAKCKTVIQNIWLDWMKSLYTLAFTLDFTLIVTVYVQTQSIWNMGSRTSVCPGMIPICILITWWLWVMSTSW